MAKFKMKKYKNIKCSMHASDMKYNVEQDDH